MQSALTVALNSNASNLAASKLLRHPGWKKKRKTRVDSGVSRPHGDPLGRGSRGYAEPGIKFARSLAVKVGREDARRTVRVVTKRALAAAREAAAAARYAYMQAISEEERYIVEAAYIVSDAAALEAWKESTKKKRGRPQVRPPGYKRVYKKRSAQTKSASAAGSSARAGAMGSGKDREPRKGRTWDTAMSQWIPDVGGAAAAAAAPVPAAAAPGPEEHTPHAPANGAPPPKKRARASAGKSLPAPALSADALRAKLAAVQCAHERGEWFRVASIALPMVLASVRRLWSTSSRALLARYASQGYSLYRYADYEVDVTSDVMHDSSAVALRATQGRCSAGGHTLGRDAQSNAAACLLARPISRATLLALGVACCDALLELQCWRRASRTAQLLTLIFSLKSRRKLARDFGKHAAGSSGAGASASASAGGAPAASGVPAAPVAAVGSARVCSYAAGFGELSFDGPRGASSAAQHTSALSFRLLEISVTALLRQQSVLSADALCDCSAATEHRIAALSNASAGVSPLAAGAPLAAVPPAAAPAAPAASGAFDRAAALAGAASRARESAEDALTVVVFAQKLIQAVAAEWAGGDAALVRVWRLASAALFAIDRGEGAAHMHSVTKFFGRHHTKLGESEAAQHARGAVLTKQERYSGMMVANLHHSSNYKIIALEYHLKSASLLDARDPLPALLQCTSLVHLVTHKRMSVPNTCYARALAFFCRYRELRLAGISGARGGSGGATSAAASPAPRAASAFGFAVAAGQHQAFLAGPAVGDRALDATLGLDTCAAVAAATAADDGGGDGAARREAHDKVNVAVVARAGPPPSSAELADATRVLTEYLQVRRVRSAPVCARCRRNA